jgi:hypothetical protein
LPAQQSSNQGSQSTTKASAKQKYGGITRSNGQERGSFLESHHPDLVRALDAIIDDGDMVGISRTSDGGAICIYIKSGKDVFKSFCASQEELDETIKKLTQGS